MKDEININDIETIPIKYSKYANSLEKLFKSYSLDSLKKSLNNPKKYVFREFEAYKKPQAELLSEKINILPAINSRQNTQNHKQIESIQNRKEKSPSRSTSPRRSPKKTRIPTPRRDESPDPGKYNINYDSVLKKAPGVVAWKNSVKNIKNRRDIEVLNTFESHIPLETEKKETLPDKYELNAPSTRNHTLKFTQYGIRKDIVKTEVLPIISYIGQEDFSNEKKRGNAIDFRKCIKRNIDEVFQINKNPSAYDYTPKYDLVMSNNSGFKKQISPEYKKKKYLLHKMMMNYNVGTEYQTVKFD